MTHSLNKIYIHAVICTKYRNPLISRNIEKEIYKKIAEVLKNDCGCSIIEINGTEEHVHLLFLLGSTKSIAEIFNKIKGKVSYWINNNLNLDYKFYW